MKATIENIRKYQGQKVWAKIFVNSHIGSYINIVTDLGIFNTCSGGFGNGIITNFVPYNDGFKKRYEGIIKPKL